MRNRAPRLPSPPKRFSVPEDALDYAESLVSARAPELLPHWKKIIAEAHRAKLLALEVNAFEEERQHVLKYMNVIMRAYPSAPLPLTPERVAARHAAGLPDGIAVELDEPARRPPRELHDRILFYRRFFEDCHKGLIRTTPARGRKGTRPGGATAFAANLIVRLRFSGIPLPSALVFGLLARVTSVEVRPDDIDQMRRRWEQTLASAKKLADAAWAKAPKQKDTNIPTDAEEVEALIYARVV